MNRLEARLFSYRYANVPLITKHVADEILRALSQGSSSITTSLDLGLTQETVILKRDLILIREFEIPINDIKYVSQSRDRDVYAILEGKLVPVELYDDRTRKFYKLVNTGFRRAPTIEISGIHMHRIENTDPMRDAYSKVKSLGSLRGALVLDTCTGLGYTAIWAYRLGARLVITCEVDENVLRIAELNPWSKELESKIIRIVNDDVLKVVEELDDEMFTHVIHDPPRIEVAGELYSEEFYRELYRVLKPNGKLFHYTGKPGKHSGTKYIKGIKARLERAGFLVIRWIEEAEGFLAVKPR